jgi:hypothetical protein
LRAAIAAFPVASGARTNPRQAVCLAIGGAPTRLLI